MTAVTSSSEAPFSKLVPWVSFVGAMFLITYLDRAMFGPLLHYFEQEYDIGHARSTSFLFYISLGYSISLFLSGFTSAKVRPRIMVGGSIISCGLVLVGISFADNLRLFDALFFTLGVAAGHYFNGGLSTMRSIVPPSQWSKAISIHEMGPNGSFIFGPILAEVGAAYFGWRGVVMGMGILSIVAGVLFLLFAKGGEAPSAKVPFRNLDKLLKQPKLWLFAWLMSLAIAGEFAPYSVLTLHLTNDRMFSQESAAWLLTTSRIASPIAVLCGGWVALRFGTMRTLAFCMVSYALGMLLMAMPGNIPLFIGMYTQPVLTAMIFPPIFTFLAESYSHNEQPMLLAVTMPIASFIGVGIMPPMLGMWGEYVSFNAGFVMMGVLVATSLPMLKFMGAGKRESA